MAWSTVHIMYVYIAAACLDGDAVITASKVSVMNVDIFGVLQVNSVRVGACLRGRDGQVMNHDSLTAIELEMALRAVDDADTSYSDIGTAIKPQCRRFDLWHLLQLLISV